LLDTVPKIKFLCQIIRFFDYGGSRIFEYSVAISDIWAKFDTEAKNDLPERDLLPDFTSDKIQDGGRRHFEIHINGYNSSQLHICT